MCGIAGIVTKRRNINATHIESIMFEMIDSIKWRGPDGHDIYLNLNNNGSVALGHCRLSIFDLSDNGKQPMSTEDSRYTITYNGEIYNYKMIRNELIKCGHHFKSNCDTEVVLYACVEWGIEKAVSKFNGMFAFALYDREENQIWLCRDRLGVKPLYYYLKDNELIFCSDIRGIYCIPWLEKHIDKRMLYGYLWSMFVPAPYTIFEDVYKLESGTYIQYNISNNKAKKYRYWDIDNFHVIDNGLSYSEYLYNLKMLLSDAVKQRMEADVPIGVFLSGGIDSSVISALAQESCSSKKINTYSIGFQEKRNDDAVYAKAVAGMLGTNHHELYCTAQDAFLLIEKIPEAYSEPFSDNSLVPTMILSRMTKEHVTVTLSGDGGDELFIGYPTYLTQRRLYKARFLASLFSKTIAPIARKSVSLYNYKRWKIDKFSNATNINNIILLDFCTVFNLLDTLIPEYMEDKYREFQKRIYMGKTDSYFDTRDIMSQSIRQSLMVGLQDDMLVKIDRASMYYSLECRCPFLDYRIVENSLQTPNDYKYRHGRLKAPLKDILKDYIPQNIIDRPKEGFGMPVNKWLHGEWNEIVNDYLGQDYIKNQGLFNANGVNQFLVEFNGGGQNPVLDRLAFSLLIFQLWWKNIYYK